VPPWRSSPKGIQISKLQLRSLVLSTGLAVPTVGVNAFATASKYIDKMIVVKYVLMRLFLLSVVRFIIVT